LTLVTAGPSRCSGSPVSATTDSAEGVADIRALGRLSLNGKAASPE